MVQLSIQKDTWDSIGSRKTHVASSVLRWFLKKEILLKTKVPIEKRVNLVKILEWILEEKMKVTSKKLQVIAPKMSSTLKEI